VLIGTYIAHKVGVNKYKHVHWGQNFTGDVLAHFSTDAMDFLIIMSLTVVPSSTFSLTWDVGIDELFGGLEYCCVLGGSAVILEGREGERRKLGEEGHRKGREREGGMKGEEGEEEIGIEVLCKQQLKPFKCNSYTLTGIICTSRGYY